MLYIFTFEHWHDLPYGERSEAGELSEGALQVEEGHARQQQHEQIGNEEGT